MELLLLLNQLVLVDLVLVPHLAQVLLLLEFFHRVFGLLNCAFLLNLVVQHISQLLASLAAIHFNLGNDSAPRLSRLALLVERLRPYLLESLSVPVLLVGVDLLAIKLVHLIHALACLVDLVQEAHLLQAVALLRPDELQPHLVALLWVLRLQVQLALVAVQIRNLGHSAYQLLRLSLWVLRGHLVSKHDFSGQIAPIFSVAEVELALLACVEPALVVKAGLEVLIRDLFLVGLLWLALLRLGGL